MAGNPHPVLAMDEKFRGYLPPRNWTLCVGAGVSKGIAPEWSELAYEVVAETFRSGISRNEFNQLCTESGWTLDSWIQAAANRHTSAGKSAASFRDLIESKLYSKIRNVARGMGIDRELTRVLNLPKSAPKDRVIEVCELIENEFQHSSLVQIGNALIRSARVGKGPAAILTFNADTFLETYIDLKLRTEHYLGPGPHSHPKYYFVQLTRPTSMQGDKTPIIHCHGSVAPEYSVGKRPRDSRDRLVFLEQEYIAMSHAGAAWGQITFLHFAQSSRLVFVGMSMSDSNVRRWMSAAESERGMDRHIFSYASRPNPDHIWVRPQPKNSDAAEITLYSLHHLGIRPAWIPDWKYLGAGIENMAAVPAGT